jgi:hypothetical protein
VKREVVAGGITQADVNDPYIQGIVSFALGALDGSDPSTFRRRIHRILEASQQVCLLLICIVAVVYCIGYCSKIPLNWYS